MNVQCSDERINHELESIDHLNFTLNVSWNKSWNKLFQLGPLAYDRVG